MDSEWTEASVVFVEDVSVAGTTILARVVLTGIFVVTETNQGINDEFKNIISQIN